MFLHAIFPLLLHAPAILASAVDHQLGLLQFQSHESQASNNDTTPLDAHPTLPRWLTAAFFHHNIKRVTCTDSITNCGSYGCPNCGGCCGTSTSACGTFPYGECCGPGISCSYGTTCCGPAVPGGRCCPNGVTTCCLSLNGPLCCYAGQTCGSGGCIGVPAFDVNLVTVSSTSTVTFSSGVIVTSTAVATSSSIVNSEIVSTTTLSTTGIATITSTFTSTAFVTVNAKRAVQVPFATSTAASTVGASSEPQSSSSQILVRKDENYGNLEKRVVSAFTYTIYFFSTVTSGSTSTVVVSSTISVISTVYNTRTSTVIVGATSSVIVSTTITTIHTLTSGQPPPNTGGPNTGGPNTGGANTGRPAGPTSSNFPVLQPNGSLGNSLSASLVGLIAGLLVSLSGLLLIF